MTQIPKAPPKSGRPRVLDDARRSEICDLITAGCGIDGAARFIGCSISTIQREAKRNRAFNERLRRACLENELGPLSAIRQAANTHWRAAAWLLERTNVQRFAKQDVRHVKPEQLHQFATKLVDALLEDSDDPETCDRMMHKLERMIADFDRELRANDLDALPKPRRPRQAKPEQAFPVGGVSDGPCVGGVSDADEPQNRNAGVSLGEASHTGLPHSPINDSCQDYAPNAYQTT